MRQVVGRFAPSPSGALHPGSLVAAMASWLDVRVHQGRWLLRIEDLDRPREAAGATDDIVATLHACGFRWDGPILRQSDRTVLYGDAFEVLRDRGAVYPCACTRREIEEAIGIGHGETSAAVYPGTCRHGLPSGRTVRAWRMTAPDRESVFEDRAAGRVIQNVAREVGDFVVRRADGLWAYQLAVVVDDAAEGITDVVRGADLLDSTPRQRLLQEALGLPHPRTLHVPLVLDEAGQKLSKSTGAECIDLHRPQPALARAAAHLGLALEPATTIEDFWERATRAWASRWKITTPWPS